MAARPMARLLGRVPAWAGRRWALESSTERTAKLPHVRAKPNHCTATTYAGTDGLVFAKEGEKKM